MSLDNKILSNMLLKLQLFHSQSVYASFGFTISQKKPIFRLLFTFVRKFGKSGAANIIMLWAVILCYRIFTFPDRKAEVYQFGHGHNNLRAFSRMNACLATKGYYDVEINGKSLRLIKRLRVIFKIRSTWIVASELARLHHPNALVHIQCVIAGATWLVYSHLILPQSIKVVCVANDHSPSPFALSYLAKKEGRKTCYIQHASVTEYFPPLHFDLSILYDRNTALAYESSALRHGVKSGSTVILLSPFESEFIRPTSNLPFSPYCVGLCLSLLPDIAHLIELLKLLSIRPEVKEIRLRPHPRCKMNLSPLFISRKVKCQPLDESVVDFLNDVDLVLAPNSGIVIESLHQGVPTFYMAGIDKIPYDYYGFVKKGILPKFTIEILNDPKSIISFFDHEWEYRFSFYDEGVLNDTNKGIEVLVSSLLILLEKNENTISTPIF